MVINNVYKHLIGHADRQSMLPYIWFDTQISCAITIWRHLLSCINSILEGLHLLKTSNCKWNSFAEIIPKMIICNYKLGDV